MPRERRPVGLGSRRGLRAAPTASNATQRFRLFGESKEGIDLEAIVHQQMQEPYFPVGMEVAEGLVDFVAGAHVLVHEAQYTPEEKLGPKAGWGKSSWKDAARTACQAEVGVLYLSHHDPARADDKVFAILDRAREIFPRAEVETENTVCEFPDCN